MASLSSVEQSASTRAPPAGYSVHREGTTEILTHDGSTSSNTAPDAELTSAGQRKKQVFINPIQEFNRDISIVALRAWSELVAEEKREARSRKQRNNAKPKGKDKDKQKRPQVDEGEPSSSKRRKVQDVEGENGEAPVATDATAATDALIAAGTPEDQANAEASTSANAASAETEPVAQVAEKPQYTHTFTLFEGLSATGLRSIRYAKEVPSLRWVQANDLEAKAADNIRMNVEWNGLGEDASDPNSKGKGKVRVSQGDCCSVLYAHRGPRDRFDAIDLDPYGTAAPFIDGAVQAVSDGGLLCVTCTDLAVLAGSNYPEKCFSNYGGTPIKAEYCHEGALRLLLHTLAQSAARYGRHIKPVLSLSIDYYVRVFVRVYTSPAQVKRLAMQTALVYVCHQCHAFYLQRLGKCTEKKGNLNYGYAAGPPVGQKCEHCEGTLHLSGPMWADELHDPAFIDRMLAVQGTFGTATRIKGMLTVAKHELAAPFYFTPSKLASLFHASSPALGVVASALVNGGYSVSRSHACPGSIKTDAPRTFLLDIMRKWIEINPVKPQKEGTPAKAFLDKPATHEVSLERNRDAEVAMLGDVKVVRYQTNPTEHWGPQKKAGN